MEYKVKGITDEVTTCAACQKPNRACTVILEDENGKRNYYGRDCASKLLFGVPLPHRHLVRLQRLADAWRTEEALTRQWRMDRIASCDVGSMDVANKNYIRTGRPNLGSYLAENRGRMVRVDGMDAEDVEFYEKLGFVAITAPITRNDRKP